jgi:hypothetical protein
MATKPLYRKHDFLDGARVRGLDVGAVKITQAAHGLAAGDVVRLSGANYIKAKADTAVNAEAIGMVASAPDANNFVLISNGRITGLAGLTAGAAYYLSPTTSGAITDTEPTTIGQVSKPILIAESATTGWLVNMRGSIVTSIGSGSGSSEVGPDDLTTFNAYYGTPLTYDEEFSGSGSALPTGWGWTNQGAATFEKRFGAGILQSVASDPNLRMITRNLPTEATWTAYLAMTSASANNTGGDASFYGIVLHESATSKSVMIRKASQSGAIVSVCTTNGFGGAANVGASDVPSYASGKQVFRVKRNSATSYDFYFSADGGISWATLVLAYNVTANFTTAPDKIGFLCYNNIAHVVDFAAHWFRVR